MKISQRIVFAITILLIVTGCGVNSSIMLKSPRKVHYTNASEIPMQPKTAYVISIDDKIQFQLYTNQGEALLLSNADVNLNGSSVGGKQEIIFTVDRYGMVELPKLGKVKIQGLTIEECEDLLEKLYGEEYLNPFVQVQILNQRVLVFPGEPGKAMVVPLDNNNTTLMEALAIAGGIAERGKASTIRLIRKEGEERKVYSIDLRTMEGLPYGDLIVQANDYIYVEPTTKFTREIIKDIAPIIQIVSSSLVIITVFSNLK